MENKNLSLMYYAKIDDENLSDLFIQDIIYIKRHLLVCSNYSYQDCPDTGISTGSYIVFYLGGPINHCTHVPGPVSQSSDESDSNAACTKGMSLAYFRMINNEFLNKYPDVVPEQALLIILDSKQAVFMDKNGKDTKYTRDIATRMKL